MSSFLPHGLPESVFFLRPMGGIALRASTCQSRRGIAVRTLCHTSLESFFEVIRPDWFAIRTCITTLARPICKILRRVEFSLGQDGIPSSEALLPLMLQSFGRWHQLGGRKRTS